MATILAVIAMSPATLPAQVTDPNMALALRVLKSTPLIDGHNDLPWRIRRDSLHPGDVAAYDLRQHTRGMTDFARLRQGHVGGQFWSVYVPAEPDEDVYASTSAMVGEPAYARLQLEQIDLARRMIEQYPDQLELATTAADVRRIFHAGKIASMLGIEGGHAIENSLGVLRAYYDLGVRYMTLTHSLTTDWADAATDSARHGGLTPFGEEVVREMNRLGMLVDLSHVSPGTMSDALNVAEAPVIFSHSSARALTDHPRNVPDSILKRLPVNGGVVMVAFVSSFITQAAYEDDIAQVAELAELNRRVPNDPAAVRNGFAAWRKTHPRPIPTVADVADHIDHIRKVASVDNVGIGSDFDGFNDTITGLSDVSMYPNLFAELARRGWSESDLRKLAGENVLRAMEQAQRAAERLRRERPSSTKTIAQLDHQQ
jgi:membrane dipeptidase